MALDCALPVSYPDTLNDFAYEPVSFKTSPCFDSDTSMDVYPPEFKSTAHRKLIVPKTKSLDGTSSALTRWTTKHPQHWSKEEVLDWIYYVVDQEHLDGSRVCGEAYQCLTGKDLCDMTEHDFKRADPYCGSRLFAIFRNLLKSVSIIEPKIEPDTDLLDSFNTKHSTNQHRLTREVCAKAYDATSAYPPRQRLHGNQQQRQQQTSKLSNDGSREDLVVYQTDNDMKVDLPLLGLYSISTDIEFPVTSSASNLYNISASRLAASASFTTPPPAPHCSFQGIPTALSPSLLSSSTDFSAGSTSSSPSYLKSSTSGVSSSSLSSYSSSSSSLSSNYKGYQARPMKSCSRGGGSSSSLSATSSSSSLSLSLSLSVSRNMKSSSSSSSSLSSSSGHRLESAHDSGYVSDDGGPHSFMPPVASPRPSNVFSDGTAFPLDDDDDVMEITGVATAGCLGNGGIPGNDCLKKKNNLVKKNKTGHGNKNNHLWEFIRDLLQNPNTNPKLLKWEDKERGVFRFVQSEKVAKLWGDKKNNPMMTYEKLSRAMRFCRSAGYFTNVPKNGRFPKKLCFMFGEKATGWRD